MPAHEASLTQTPLHVLGLVLRHLDTLHSLGAAVLAHPVLHAAFFEDPARIVRDILDAQMSPATARLAFAAHTARRVDRASPAAVRAFADEWLVHVSDEAAAAAAAAADETGGPLGVWPWGLSLPDVVSMSKAHGVVEALTARLVRAALPACCEEGLFGTTTPRRATPAEVKRIHRILYGYEIYCGLLFREAGDCAAHRSWRAEINFQLSAALYRGDVTRAYKQLACVHDFLENIVLQVEVALKQVAMYDVTWGAHEVDYLSTGSTNEHVQAYLSLGLDFIYKLAQAGTPLPASASPDEHLAHFRRLRHLLLTHRYSSTSPLPPATPYMLACELDAHNRAHLAAAGAVERQHALHLWDEPPPPPAGAGAAAAAASATDEVMRADVAARWAAEGVAREKEVDEWERPAMKRSWARRRDMYEQGYRGFYKEHM
ncbi:hypothetical protein CCM_07574 [Cordyceps militaris CM01]|uniref:Uncharacterized protein n=1 Tax=Cordyceps militaris (strain CM01) TaxID=983644 RepID=G3JQ72_CORMM|nr:uncharacterized protein CCM_07574 [Cordyceps militaris CM01]EGX89323.1 hypothetical protein CCM_07574 [Cordyceps militaris CM01]